MVNGTVTSLCRSRWTVCGRRLEGKRWRLMIPKTSGIGPGELMQVQFTGLGNKRHWMIVVEDNIQV